ncbi:MAG: hypothetical protein IT489_03155 [Gammaproteobacteria bacterium]|nr:hypothetical protein [Gammaproteobacteria bacterium]
MSALAKPSDIAIRESLAKPRPVSEDPDISVAIKHALVRDARESTHSRAEIADRLTAAAGRAITVAQVDAWTAATKPHRFPAELVPAWVMVTRSRRLLDLLCRAAGLYLADQTTYDLAEYGRTQIREQKLHAAAVDLRSSLWDKV